jgi:inhibitor of KinA sporulation pathway (predicted exonuclease)
VEYTLKFFRGLGHSINMDVLGDVGRFLQRHLPHDAAFALKPKPPGEMSIKELKAAVRQHGLAAQAAGFYEKAEFVRLLEDFYANTL